MNKDMGNGNNHHIDIYDLDGGKASTIAGMILSSPTTPASGTRNISGV